MKKLVFGILTLILLVGVLCRYAEPVGDGDLFWQMAYGRYLVEHGTAVPDHTIFSWTPATNDTIYCSWVAEIFFYLAYLVGGLPLLFFFRYACVLACLGLMADFARRLGARDPRLSWGARPEYFLLAEVLVLASYVGTILKPEIFSLVAFNLLAWGYFTMKLQARDPGANPGRWLWFFPVLMVVWVNSHGVFMFGLLTLGFAVLGEGLNRWLAPELALPSRYLKAFSLSAGLSALACFLTPYTYRYPLQLFKEWLGMLRHTQSAGDAAAYASLAAHQKINEVPAFHFVSLLVFMLGVLLLYAGLLAWYGGRGKRVDCGLVLVTLVTAALYPWYVRTTYYFPPFFVYSVLYLLFLLHQGEGRALALVRARFAGSALAVLVFLAVTAGSVFQSLFAPFAGNWFGFGISYWNPVLEAEWIARFDPQARIYNDYDGGGYLLWRLYPQTKVMIDPRSFPYRAWYAAYNLFENGEMPYREFTSHFDKCDLAVISSKNEALYQSFAESGEWVVAWVGPSSAIFCRPGKRYPAEAAMFLPDRFKDYRNLFRGLDTFQMCSSLGLNDVASQVLDGLNRNFGRTEEEKVALDAMNMYRRAVTAEAQFNLRKAVAYHEECRRMGRFYSKPKLMDLYKALLAELSKTNRDGSKDEEIRDLAVRMSALNRDQAPPPSKFSQRDMQAPDPAPSPTAASQPSPVGDLTQGKAPTSSATPGP